MAKAPTPAAETAAVKAPAADASAAEATAVEATVEVRVIADNGEHPVNSVITLTADEAASAVAGGWADDHPSAVAYAKSLAVPAEPDADA